MLFESQVESFNGESAYIFRPKSLPSPNGFTIRLTPSDSRVIATLEFDDFAGELIRFIVVHLPETKALWKAVVNLQIASGAKIGVEINRQFLIDPENLPIMNWDTFYISWMLQISPRDQGMAASEFAIISDALLKISDLIGCILPFDEDDLYEAYDADGALEGGKSRVSYNRYERSRANRTACIAIFGTVCGVCGFDFESRYGDIGSGFVEVHHLTPVSMMGGESSVAPLTELIPLCSNCHSMAHTRTPPWAPSELQAKLK
jgi:5-methylcytosine-specific restriction protein A